jgi:hypothetical protein
MLVSGPDTHPAPGPDADPGHQPVQCAGAAPVAGSMSSVPLARAARLRRQVGAVACGCALAGAGLLVAFNDPSSPGSRFPGCGFHAVTGLWCPGCGLTRATHHLLTGDVAAAISSNLFTPFALLAIFAAWFTWAASTFGRTVRNPFMRIPVWGSTALIVLVVAYGVVRNLPGQPWSALAP